MVISYSSFPRVVVQKRHNATKEGVQDKKAKWILSTSLVAVFGHVVWISVVKWDPFTVDEGWLYD